MKITNNHDTKRRVDVLLAEANNSYSRAALAKLFGMDMINKNGEPLRAGDKIQPKQSFDADISPIQKPAADIEMPIIYEDENVIVVNKPMGVISHARGKYWDESSVASFIRAKVAATETGERAGIVHRLDRATSGVMVCAKNSNTMSFLQKQFSERKVKKQYIAVIEGRITPEKGIIDIPILRNPNDPKTFMANSSGKTAQTEYYTVSFKDGFAVIQMHPHTGRTHQLRVHLAYMKHPIIGDEIYGGMPAERLMLHAKSIEITIPGGHRKVFEAPVPDEINNYND